MDTCVKCTKEIGYSVMVKAFAGGSIKGIKIVWNDKECRYVIFCVKYDNEIKYPVMLKASEGGVAKE